MSNERLLVVEDERIVAEDLRDMLQRMGYRVVGIASSGEEAIRMSEEKKPDLVLMDIRLNGSLDGVEAAETIWTHQEIPVTYLTAYADEKTLERAKATLPFGYILKPFEERDLRSTIEIALYKHTMELTLKKMEGWYATAMESLAEALIATNAEGSVTFMNPAAETLTGWPLRKVYGKQFDDVFQVSSKGGQSILGARNQAIPKTRDAVAIRPEAQLTSREGQEIPFEYGISSLQDASGGFAGNVVLLRPLILQKEPERVN